MNMKKTIIYFHGFGSSPNSDKVDRIRAMYPSDTVLSFTADVDPDIAIQTVNHEILNALIDDHSDGELLFIGTSLGGWLANELSNKFECRVLLINPAYDPGTELSQFNVDTEILNRYTKMNDVTNKKKTIVLDPSDDIIDHTELMKLTTVVKYPGVGHRFNGSEFEEVVRNFVN